MKLPKIKTLNSQIDHIEKCSEESVTRLANIETLLTRVAAQLEKQGRTGVRS